MSSGAPQPASSASRGRRLLRAIGLQLALAVVTLLVCEVALRLVDLRYLRSPPFGQQLTFQHDVELGWFPIPNAITHYIGTRVVTVMNNAIGLRDADLEADGRKTILVVGDSFAWGFDVEAKDRFTELLRRWFPEFRIVNAGVAGYGTDQAYLLLRRMWDAIKPDVVVLLYCVDNDRADNTTNMRYDGYYKPYLDAKPNREAQWRGLPVPQSRHVSFTENELARNLWLARAALAAFTYARHPPVHVNDPTERLIDMMRAFVQSKDAKFMIGMQRQESQLETYLTAKKIPYATFDKVDHYFGQGDHWTPKGHLQVARQLAILLAQMKVISVINDPRPSIPAEMNDTTPDVTAPATGAHGKVRRQ